MLPNFDIALFKQRLIETQIWCAQQGILSEKQLILREIVYNIISKTSYILLSDLPNLKQQRIAEIIFLTRQILLPPPTPIIETLSGQLLLFFPKCMFAWDGVAELSSKGFFTFDNYPPFDTWVYYTKGSREDCFPQTSADHIIAWIPSNYIDLVNQGLSYNPDNSLIWLSNLEKKEIEHYGYSELLNLQQIN